MKKNVFVIYGIVFSLLLIMFPILQSELISTTIPNNGIWTYSTYPYTDSVVLNNTSYSVNIGDNKSTDYMLNVNGSIGCQFYLDMFGDIYLRNMHSLILGYDGAHEKGYLSNNSLLGIILNSYVDLDLKATQNININAVSDSVNINGYRGINLNSDTYANENLSVTNTCIAKGFIGYGIVPIGTLQMWCANLTNTPSLPDGWEIADGHVCVDSDSVYYNVVLPNLINMFVKGYTESNITGGNNSYTLGINDMPEHYHTYSDSDNNAGVSSTGTPMTLSGASPNRRITNNHFETIDIPTNSVGGGQPFDNQPSYYTVVYIIRVK